MTLEACDEQRLDRALDEIGAMDFHVERPVVLPMFDAPAGAA
jgi:hypothetical protein